ncbi:MAG: hypothetical protein ACYC4I_00895 [Minisyncoccota bacterium]
MPLVLIQFKQKSLEFTARRLALQMPRIVAAALDVSDQEGEAGRLAPDDIEVWCQEGSDINVNTKDLEIIIWTHDFPSRRARLEQRKNEIVGHVHELISSLCSSEVSGFVWILLQPTAFGAW